MKTGGQDSRQALRFVEVFPKQVEGRQLMVIAGQHDMFLEQIVEKSRQPDIAARTPKDATQRFRSLETARQWLAGGRQLYMLTDEGGDVGGIIWYAYRRIPAKFRGKYQENHTFAIRLYEGYNGKGLSEKFMQDTLKDYFARLEAGAENAQDFRGLWLQTGTDNIVARHAYKKRGFEQIANDGQRVTMILPAEKITL
jgi:hypothetical protein